MGDIATLQREHDTLREQHEAARLAYEIAEFKAVEKALDASLRHVPEATCDRVDRREFLYDDPSFGIPQGPISLLDDRLDGRDRQVFENEIDLAIIRGRGRVLVSEFPTGKNIVELLTNYTVGAGTKWSAEADGEEVPAGMADAAQKVLDTFLDLNDWPGDYERELRRRIAEDGESFTALFPDGWRTRLEPIEPPAVTEPAIKRDLETWLGCAERHVSSWSFGIHSRADRPSEPLGYHVVRDTAGANWDYFPANDIAMARHCKSGLMEHIKAPGSLRSIKRSVSEFYPVFESLEATAKLLNNAAVGATVQASIAWIEEHAAGVSSDSVLSRLASKATQTVTERTAGGGQRTIYAQKSRAGRVIHTGGNTVYKPAPMGSSNAPNFLLIEQALLRYAGIRWAMPEYMVSMDASNQNYASILEAGTPFVNSREAEQAYLCNRFKRIAWKVLRIAFDAGFFSRFGLGWEHFERFVRVEVTAPDIKSKKAKEDEDIRLMRFTAGILSKQTWQEEVGLDPDKETERGAAPAQPPGAPATPEATPESDAPSTVLADKNLLTNRRVGKRTAEIAADLTAGQITPAVAKAQLGNLGYSAGDVEAIVSEVSESRKIVEDWVTIGGGSGEGSGGTPVFIDGDGKIAKGPKSLAGQGVGSIKKNSDKGGDKDNPTPPKKDSPPRENTPKAEFQDAKTVRKIDPKKPPGAESMRNSVNSLPEAEKETLRRYTSGEIEYRDINAGLRSGKPLKGQNKKDFEAVNSAIEKAGKLPEGTTVYRGLNLPDDEKAAMVAKFRAGQGSTIDIPGLHSTSVDPQAAAGFARGSKNPVVMEIKPKTGAYLTDVSTFDKIARERGGVPENEVLLPHGKKYRVVGVQDDVQIGKKGRKGSGYTVLQLEEIDDASESVNESIDGGHWRLSECIDRLCEDGLDCGTGDGGFKSGNKCGGKKSGGGGNSDRKKVKKQRQAANRAKEKRAATVNAVKDKANAIANSEAVKTAKQVYRGYAYAKNALPMFASEVAAEAGAGLALSSAAYHVAKLGDKAGGMAAAGLTGGLVPFAPVGSLGVIAAASIVSPKAASKVFTKTGEAGMKRLSQIKTFKAGWKTSKSIVGSIRGTRKSAPKLAAESIFLESEQSEPDRMKAILARAKASGNQDLWVLGFYAALDDGDDVTVAEAMEIADEFAKHPEAEALVGIGDEDGDDEGEPTDATESVLQAAIEGALQSVETEDEARRILESVRGYP